jgi:hypothetical protein
MSAQTDYAVSETLGEMRSPSPASLCENMSHQGYFGLPLYLLSSVSGVEFFPPNFT